MPSPITPENVTRVVLENGIVVLVKENHTNASFALRGRVRAGAMYDDQMKGSAQFTAAALSRGTRKYSFQKLNEIYDTAGMNFSVGAGTETASFGGRALSEDFDLLLDIAADVLLQPKFPPKQIAKLRAQFVTGLREALDDTRYVAFKNFRALLYPPGHPYHDLADGTEESLEQIERGDLAKFHARFYRPEGAIFVVVGDVRADEVVEKIRARFGGWSGEGSAPTFEIPDIPPRRAPLRERFELPGKIQSDIVMGYPGIRRNDPDFYALRVADLIFGQMGLYGRLGERVRDKMGLAYYVYSSFDAGIGAGPWTIGAGVNPRNVQRAIEGIIAEAERLRTEGVTQDELTHAQDFLTGSLALRLETNDGLAATLTDIELYGLGLDYIQRYPDIIRSQTLDSLRAAVQKHAHIENAVTVVAGPPASAMPPAEPIPELFENVAAVEVE
jgi:zinc protease